MKLRELRNKLVFWTVCPLSAYALHIKGGWNYILAIPSGIILAILMVFLVAIITDRL